LHRAGPPRGRRRAPAVPAVRPAAGSQGPPLSPAQRLPPLGARRVVSIPVTDALDLLRHGSLELEGRLVEASNTTLRAHISLDGVGARCVYKPVRGERPLWDFPDGTLAGREVAAYLVSATTGWNVVPPTVLRDGPFGEGMVQLWMDGDETVDLARLIRTAAPALPPMALP